jgi:hypothetical protein
MPARLAAMFAILGHSDFSSPNYSDRNNDDENQNCYQD